ncbi:hypothetical protein [Candidatus Solirubrobacter pratensis]|uniref:hypothetical protein n=1 Tax=Candidatus Solirubrobacter pratensis TaxID=1298857 RepID=UPI0012DE58B3|nr:hypothetical protein [Candidatus Solirubrobacter pratensis]
MPEPERSAALASRNASPVARCTLPRVSAVSGSAISRSAPSSSSIQTEPMPERVSSPT